MQLYRIGRASARGDAAALHEALRSFIRVYQFRDRDRICCHGLSVTQCHALEALVREGPLRLNELSARLYLEKSTVSRVVGSLEGKGLVQRRAHPEDGRAVQLEPTSAGRRLHARIEAEVCAQEAELLSEFEPEVRRGVTRLIERLTEAAARRVDTSAGGCCRIEDADARSEA